MSSARGLKRLAKSALLVGAAADQHVRCGLIGRYVPCKPTTVQLAIADYCNSGCVMCNIHTRSPSEGISAEELRHVLSDELFSRVRYIGISGGEPTLRADLVDLGRAIVECLPTLRGMSILSNAVNPEEVIERILALESVATAAKVPFGVSISVDGIGQVHDRNRGVEGNFASAVRVIDSLMAAGVRVGVGCTLTPQNCLWADDVLLWCQERHIAESEFRLAVDIRRIHNAGYSASNPFTAEERFHLIMFFDKLSQSPAVDATHRLFYRSLVRQLAFGAPREAGCDWRWRGVTLDARGCISFCSVESPTLGSALESSAWEVFRAGLPERRRILRECCGDCRHDLLGPERPSELLRRAAAEIAVPARRELKALKHIVRPNEFRLESAVVGPAERDSPSQWRHVVVTGWYGTETAGDKAILGEVLHFIRAYAPACRVTLTTLDRKVSQQTSREVEGAESVRLVDMESASDPALIESADAVLIGGGPLEEIPATEHIFRTFREANRQHKARVIFGCGIGPLFSERLRQMVGGICQLATAGFLRDVESHKYALALGATAPLGCACDPSIAYIRRWLENAPVPPRQCTTPPSVVGLLRANTSEYIPEMSPEELGAVNRRTAHDLAEVASIVCERNGATLSLLPMHTLSMGGDDRLFNRTVAREVRPGVVSHVERRYLSLEMLLEALVNADVAVAMRYHGHLFCLALGIPFLSVDYTRKTGKVESLVKRLGYDQWCERWGEVDVERTASRLDDLMASEERWSSFLRERTDELLAGLADTYTSVFGN